MSKESKLVKNTMIIAIGNIFTKCMSFFLLPMYTSLLTTKEYGVIDIISTYITMFTILLTLQFEQALFRYLVETRNNKNQQKKYISTSIWVIIFINIIFIVIFTPILIINNYEYTWELIIWAILSCLYTLLIQIPRGLGNNIIYTIGNFINGSLNIILNILFLVIFKLKVEGMLYATILSLVVSIIYILNCISIWKYINIKNINKTCLHNLSKYAFPLVPYTLCWWIINVSDRWIINIFLGDSANGIYSIAYKFPLIFTTIIGIFQTAWTESAAENFNTEDKNEYYQNIVNKSIRFYSSMTIGIISCIPLLFSFFIKHNFIEAYNYIPFLMLGSLLHGISAIYGSIYFAYKKTKEVAWTAAISAILNILINLIFIKKIGLYAAVLSTLVSYFVAVIIRQKDIQKFTPILLNLKYLFIEAIVYIFIFICYYSQKTKIQIISLILLVPYCIYQNKEIFIIFIYKFFLKKRRS